MKRIALLLALFVPALALAQNGFDSPDYWRENCDGIDNNGDGIVDNNRGGGKDSLTRVVPSNFGGNQVYVERCQYGVWRAQQLDSSAFSGALFEADGGLQTWGKVHCGGQGQSCPRTPDYNAGNFSTAQAIASPLAENGCPATAGVGCRFSIDDFSRGDRYKADWPPQLAWNDATRYPTLRIRVAQGDQMPGASHNRNMLAVLKEGSKTQHVEGDGEFFSFQLYIPSGTRQVREAFPNPLPWSTGAINSWNLIFQGHQTGDCGGPPPWSFGLKRTAGNGNLYRFTLEQTAVPNQSATTTIWGSDNDPLDDDGIVARDRWIQVTLYVKFSRNPSIGKIALWLNGVRQFSKNLNTMWTATSACHSTDVAPGGSHPEVISLGLYRDSRIPGTATMFIRGFQSSTTCRKEYGPCN